VAGMQADQAADEVHAHGEERSLWEGRGAGEMMWSLWTSSLDPPRLSGRSLFRTWYRRRVACGPHRHGRGSWRSCP